MSGAERGWDADGQSSDSGASKTRPSFGARTSKCFTTCVFHLQVLPFAPEVLCLFLKELFHRALGINEDVMLR